MAPQTVLQALKTIPDPRKRQGRQYPLYGLLAILLVAAMQGERSLREWGCGLESEKSNGSTMRLWVCGRYGEYRGWLRFGMR